MKVNQKLLLGMMIVLLTGLPLYGQSNSISAIRSLSRSKIQKAGGDVHAYLNRIAQHSLISEQIKQGKFTILLNPLSNGQYEVQAYRILSFGNKRVISTFASLYQSGIEYSYSYDTESREIRQYHFLCPPNSLTCWADPSDYSILTQFDWQESFPSENCSMPVFTSEEYGREYLQASCFISREAALAFAKKFITYTNRNRM